LPHLYRPALDQPKLLHNGYLAFAEGKAAGARRWPHTPI